MGRKGVDRTMPKRNDAMLEVRQDRRGVRHRREGRVVIMLTCDRCGVKVWELVKSPLHGCYLCGGCYQDDLIGFIKGRIVVLRSAEKIKGVKVETTRAKREALEELLRDIDKEEAKKAKA